jgi:hypothetical protein
MMNNINNEDRLNLKKLVSEMECENNTEKIRELKHSHLIREDVTKLLQFKKDNLELFTSDYNSFMDQCRNAASFLFMNYMDIFNKLCKNELDLRILSQVLELLEAIEEGKVDQHEGSAIFGKLLKEMYIDSALRTGHNLEQNNGEDVIIEPVVGKPISWKEYKNLR